MVIPFVVQNMYPKYISTLLPRMVKADVIVRASHSVT